MDSSCPSFPRVKNDIQRTKEACRKDWKEFQALHKGVAEEDIRKDFEADFKGSNCPPNASELEAFLEKQRALARELQEKEEAQKAKGCANFASQIRKDTQSMSSKETQKLLDQTAIVYDDGARATIAGQVNKVKGAEKVVRPEECPNKAEIQSIVEEKILKEALAMWDAFQQKEISFEAGKRRLYQVKKEEEDHYKALRADLKTKYFDRLIYLAQQTQKHIR